MKKERAPIQESNVLIELKSGTAEVFGLDARCEDWSILFNAFNRIDSNSTARSNPAIDKCHNWISKKPVRRCVFQATW